MGKPTIEDTYKLQYEGKIASNQAYRMRELIAEGYDVTAGLCIRVDGFHEGNELARMVRAGATEEEIIDWYNLFERRTDND